VSSVIQLDRDGHVLVIVLDRPEVRNAIDAELARAVADAVSLLEDDPDLWCGILAATPPVFCAGADLRALARGGFEQLRTEHGFAGLTERHRRTPLIAAVDGPALAGGWELVLACDLVVASSLASFAVPEVKRCLVAAGGGTVRLPKKLPWNVAMECLVTGDPLSAERAHLLGLVNVRCAPGEALVEARALAARVVANSPLAVAEARQAMLEGVELPEAEAFRLADEALRRAAGSADGAEGIAAFLEKRLPVWTGR
jgi:enoyl-CoA hydratase